MTDCANLLLVTFDQWRGDWGDPGNPVVQLPALSELAERGCVATRCYTASPHCVPARFSWLTGLKPSQMGITRNISADMPSDAPSVVRTLARNGWYTELVGKSHWTSHAQQADLDNNLPLMRDLGFARTIEIAGPRALQRVDCALTKAWEREGCLDSYRQELRKRYQGGLNPMAWKVKPASLPINLYPDIWLTEQALTRIEAMPMDQPWLLWVSFVGPHEPFDTPRPWSERVIREPLPEPWGRQEWIDRLPESCELKQLTERWAGKLTTADVDACRNDYARRLILLDDQLRRLMNQVVKRRDGGSTAVLVTADHGELLGDGGALYKGAFLEGAVRVPWVYRPPGGCKPTRWSRPTELTGLIEQTMKGLPAKGSERRIATWVRKCHYAVAEFGDEIMIARKGKKLVMNGRGSPIWATKPVLDPGEQLNCLEDKRIQLWEAAEWLIMRLIAAYEYRRRKSNQWIWRDLRKN